MDVFSSQIVFLLAFSLSFASCIGTGPFGVTRGGAVKFSDHDLGSPTKPPESSFESNSPEVYRDWGGDEGAKPTRPRPLVRKRARRDVAVKYADEVPNEALPGRAKNVESGEKEQKEIVKKLRDIETMQKTIKQTLDNTTQSLNEIQQLKSDLERKVKTVDEKQKEMEGTKEQLKAAVNKIADVGKDLLDRESRLKEGAEVALSKASQVREEQSEIGDALDEATEDLKEAAVENAAEKLQLAGEKSVVEAEAMRVDEEELSQLDRSVVIDDILDRTKHILEKKVVDGVAEVEETGHKLTKKIIEKEKKMATGRNREKKIESQLKELEAKVATKEEGLKEQNERSEQKKKLLAAKVKRTEKEEDELEKRVEKKKTEFEAKESVLDKKVIEEIINKTAEIIDEKVKVLEEDLKRKIDESAKKPNAGTSSLTNATTAEVANSLKAFQPSNGGLIVSSVNKGDNTSIDSDQTDVSSGKTGNESKVDGGSEVDVTAIADGRAIKTSAVKKIANATSPNNGTTVPSLLGSTSKPATVSMEHEATQAPTPGPNATPTVFLEQSAMHSEDSETSSQGQVDASMFLLPPEAMLTSSQVSSAFPASLGPEFMPSSSGPNATILYSLSTEEKQKISLGPDATLVTSLGPDTTPTSSLGPDAAPVDLLGPEAAPLSSSTPTGPDASLESSSGPDAESYLGPGAMRKSSTGPGATPELSTVPDATSKSFTVPSFTGVAMTTSAHTSGSITTNQGHVSESEISTTLKNGKDTSDPGDLSDISNTPVMDHMVFVGNDNEAVTGSIFPPTSRQTIFAFTSVSSTAPSAPHMVYVGKGTDVSVKVSKEEVSDENDHEGTKIDIGAEGGNDLPRSQSVKVDEPKHVIVVKSNISEFRDKERKGHSILNESITIVDKPLSSMDKDEIATLVGRNSAGDFDSPEIAVLHHQKRTNEPEVAALAQEKSDSEKKRSGFLGAAGWVFIGLFVCLLCVLIIVAAIFGARRRYARAQNCKNKGRPDSTTALARVSPESPDGRGSSSSAADHPAKKVPITQRMAAKGLNRTGHYFSAGYVDDISRMPEGSDAEIGTRRALSHDAQ